MVFLVINLITHLKSRTMKKISLFNGSRRTIKRIQPQLLALEKELEKIGAMENKIEAIVRLFQVVSPLHDQGGFAEELSKLQASSREKEFTALKNLQLHIRNAGRSPYGINRTQTGEEVNAGNVWLGDVFGLFTHPADFWLNRMDELKKELRPDVSKNPKEPISNWYIINDYQCGSFVSSHVDGMLANIAVLKAA